MAAQASERLPGVASDEVLGDAVLVEHATAQVDHTDGEVARVDLEPERHHAPTRDEGGAGAATTLGRQGRQLVD